MNENLIVKGIIFYAWLILGIYVAHKTRKDELSWRILVAIVFTKGFVVYHLVRCIKRIISSFIAGLKAVIFLLIFPVIVFL